MQFVDQVDICVKAGDGGNGIVAFRREKFIPRGGPSGGNGGRGGNVIIRAESGLNTLVDLRYKKHYKAERGGDGGPNDRHGKNGEDLVLRVPVGTLVFRVESGKRKAESRQTAESREQRAESRQTAESREQRAESRETAESREQRAESAEAKEAENHQRHEGARPVADLTHDGQEYVVAKGGAGGRGNASFSTSTLQTPKFAEKGEPTDEIEVRLELKLLADVGLVGYPSVGKSTLISKISAAKPKIADYPFTTLVPNLGVVKVDMNSFVVADMPGLIEGAHDGAGLGHQFLRHIERTRFIVHIIDVSGLTGRDPMHDFDAINDELRLHSEKLAALPQIVALNKADMPDAEAIVAELRPHLEERGLEVFEISALTGMGLQPLLYRIAAKLEELPREEEAPPDEVVRFTVGPSEESWDARKTGDKMYEVEGHSVEMLVRRTDLENEYALRRMHKQLDKMGVIKRLKALGVEEGDSVCIHGIEFEFTDEIYG